MHISFLPPFKTIQFYGVNNYPLGLLKNHCSVELNIDKNPHSLMTIFRKTSCNKLAFLTLKMDSNKKGNPPRYLITQLNLPLCQ
jgi:hypothetical protein